MNPPEPAAFVVERGSNGGSGAGGFVREISSSGGSGSSSRVSPLDANGNKLERWASLAWRDLTVSLDGKNKVIQSLTGYATPGTLTAIMGPSCCGKNHLLKALAGRFPSHAKVYGEVLLNGRPRYLKYGTYAYVSKGEQLIETLTVRETLYNAALLQLPKCTPCSEKTAVVDSAISSMELEGYGSIPVGGSFLVKGLTPGERKRLTIAMELLTRPTLIFCDEPIDNLDSVSAFLLVASLKKLASNGCTVVITTERTCTEVFHLLTTICLLSKGKAIFFGDTAACLELFASAGFPCPSLQNPTDHFLRALNAEFEKVNRITKLNQASKLDASVITRTLETTYNASNEAAVVEALVHQLSEKEGPFLKSRGQASFTTRVAAVTYRSFLNMSRCFTYFWLRFLLYLPLSVCIATIFYGLGDSPQLVTVRASAIFAMVSFFSLLAIAGVPALAKDIKVYRRERKNDHTSAGVFVLANFVSSSPYLLLVSAVCSSVCYFFMDFQSQFGRFVYFVVTIFLCLAIVEALLLVITSITLNVFAAILVATTIQVLMMLSGGHFRELDQVPKTVWKYPASYAAFHTYAVEGILENEYSSRRDFLRQRYASWDSSSGKWMDLWILAAMALAYRILLYFSLLLCRKSSTNNGHKTKP
ncbi:ATP-binding cassette transporter [Selaginella moellendorffii]|uniref:ATP-binding cassette transporter n=1 Tax=Selaginella moellendorffii TaxID=88036 RepID=D8RIJ5_SELML|nr:ATP-binding cassette transporter [Selaginella moellendorffii]